MAPDDWERNKATILNLYLLEKFSLKNVASYMEEKHNFVRNKSQYEYKLKKWGIKRNLSKDFWQYVDHEIKKRNGRRTEVTLFGIALPEEKIHRERLRYAAIPNAENFGTRLPSPCAPDGDIVRINTPSVVEVVVMWPSDLPWFHFNLAERVLPTLQNPTAMLQTLFSLIGSDERFLEDTTYSIQSIYAYTRNPLQLHNMFLQFARMLPQDPRVKRQDVEAITRSNSPLSMASAILKVVFYCLSNRTDDGIFFGKPQAMHDQFVLHLVDAVSQSNPQLLSTLLSGQCMTTRAIKEAVYGCAIREKNHDLVSQLLRSGVDPNLRIEQKRVRTLINFEVKWRNTPGLSLSHAQSHYFKLSGLEEAAFTYDLHLAQILLNAGADPNDSTHLGLSPLMISAFESGDTEKATKALEFTRLLVNHGALINPPVWQCPKCQNTQVSSPLLMAIAVCSNGLARFLMENGAWTDLAKCYITTGPGREYCFCFWSSEFLQVLKIGYSPLQVATISRNGEMIEFLLQLLLASPMHPQQIQVLKQLLVTSCLLGDFATSSQLLNLNLDLNTDWARGVSPLVATAWNPDTRIAERLLQLGVHVGPNRTATISEAWKPSPIHVAAFHGITNLVQQLMTRGSDCNAPIPRNTYVPFLFGGKISLSTSTPLQLAIESGILETAMVLLPSSELVGGELVQAVSLRNDSLIRDLLSRGASFFDTDKDGKSVLDSAAEVGHLEIISQYFVKGGIYRSTALYLAAKTAVESRDYCIVELLASKRPIRMIDSYEASCLVLSMKERAWDLVYLLLRDPFLSGEINSFYEHSSRQYEYRKPIGTKIGEGVTPLWASLHSQNRSIVKATIQRGYSFKFSEEIMLARAINGSEVPDDIRSEVWPPLEMSLACQQLLLLYAVKSNNLDSVRNCTDIVNSLDYDLTLNPEITRRGVRIDIMAGSPLTVAVDTRNIEIVHFLISRGATVDWQTSSGERALDFAAKRDNLAMVEALLEYEGKVDPPAQLRNGATALQYAAINGNLNMARILFDRGADVNAQRAKQLGRTALEGAAEHGRLDMIQFLLECGVKLEKEMRIYFVRAARFARNNGHYALADYLMQRGAWSDSDQVLYNHPSIVDCEDIVIIQRGPWTERYLSVYELLFISCPYYVAFLYDKESNYWQIERIRGPLFRLFDTSSWSSSAESVSQVLVDEGSKGNDYKDQSLIISPERTFSLGSTSNDECPSLHFDERGPSGFDLVPFRAETCSTLVKELDDIPDADTSSHDGIVSDGFDIGYSAGSTMDHYALDELATLDLWKQEMATRGIEVAESGPPAYMQRTDVAHRDITLSNSLETGWQGPFFGAEEIDNVFDI